jgi:uncharacterized membrane protein
MSKTSTGLDENVAGVLCYLGIWVTGIIFLILESKDKFVRFHAMQSLIAFGVIFIVALVFGWVPVVGGFISWALWILGVIIWVVCMVKAYQGEAYQLPVVGKIAADWANK